MEDEEKEIVTYLALFLLLFVGLFVFVWKPGLIGGSLAFGSLTALWLKAYWK